MTGARRVVGRKGGGVQDSRSGGRRGESADIAYWVTGPPHSPGQSHTNTRPLPAWVPLSTGVGVVRGVEQDGVPQREVARQDSLLGERE